MRTKLAVLSLLFAASMFGQATKPTTPPKIPKFKYDGAWPKLPLPNAWTFEGITGLTVTEVMSVLGGLEAEAIAVRDARGWRRRRAG